MDKREVEDNPKHAGLCGSCRSARLISSAKGETYYLCKLSADSEMYPKYPRLPVLRCPGYAVAEPGV